MRSIDAPVAVGLVEDYPAKAPKEAAPLVVPGEDVVELVGIREEDPGRLSYSGPPASLRVTVVHCGECTDPGLFSKRLEGTHLVVREGLCRVKEEECGIGVLENPLEYGEGEGEGLPRSSRGGKDDAFPGPERLDRLALVRVEPDIPEIEIPLEGGGEFAFERAVFGITGRYLLHVHDPPGEIGVGREGAEDIPDSHGQHSSRKRQKSRASETRSWQLCSTTGMSGPGFWVVRKVS